MQLMLVGISLALAPAYRRRRCETLIYMKNPSQTKIKGGKKNCTYHNRIYIRISLCNCASMRVGKNRMQECSCSFNSGKPILLARARAKLEIDSLLSYLTLKFNSAYTGEIYLFSLAHTCTLRNL